MKSNTPAWHNSHRTRSRMMNITMRDRSKNRKPLQKGRNLSIEAIQTVQALKRAANLSEATLDQVFDNKFRRLLKFDMIAVFRELLRQNQCLLALKVFRDIRNEVWYRPQLLLYAEMITVLGSNGLLEKVELLIMELKAESTVNPDIEGFNMLLQSLMNLNLTALAMECFYLMKSLSCDPDRISFKILIDGLKSNKEMKLLAIIREDAKRYYGCHVNFLEKEETEISSKSKY
ncbi:UNVERIFIED_CONTAM: Pentatricopeptide repeat-containing protein [Sesamum radiatum]|uniref:Pentatricopeptide repeat-containing protein n=1 Tax=Sesamum radiatum TaxID=300843 RepID=A0AAW2MTQ9_SESRA